MDTPCLHTLRLDIDGDAVTATLCHPERLNAVSGQLLQELVTLADWLRQRDDLHYLVLDHDGPVFSAGAHLEEAGAIFADTERVRARLRANQRLAQEALAKLAAVEQISFAAPPETAPAPPPITTPAVPVRLADSATLHYRVSGHARGLPFEAEAQLRWQRDSTRYEAEWTVPLPLIGTRAQHSVGAVTAAGLAPERYAERARGERAAHFDADGGRIRFSANRPDAVLESGAQDRLSSVLQLGGLIAADPGRYPPGSQLSLQTAGVREADPWRWQVLDDEVLHIDGQQVPCVRLLRAPRHDWDTRIELWLARPLLARRSAPTARHCGGGGLAGKHP